MAGIARITGVLKMSRRHLQSRWLESLFIVLGVALGIGVLVGMASFMRFGSEMNSHYINSLDFNAIDIRARSVDLSALYGNNSAPALRVSEDLMTPANLSLEDINEIRNVPGIRYVTLTGGLGIGGRLTAVDGESVQILDGSGHQEGPEFQMNMVTPDALTMQGRDILAGRSFTWDEFDNRDRVLVVEEETVTVAFPTLEPEEVIGHTVAATSGPGNMSGQWTIIGVVKKPEGVVMGYRPQQMESNTLVTFVPYTLTSQSEDMGHFAIHGYRVSPEEDSSEVVGALQTIFDQKYGAGRIEVRDPAEQRRQMSQSMVSTTTAIMVLAGTALLIAAVNILNLFTARVLRRQRLIGMSIALGATRKLLFWQNCADSFLLGITGSGVGLAFAAGILRLLKFFMTSQMQGQQETSMLAKIGLQIPEALIGLLVGIAVSLVFGLYPAVLAARQDPALALRTE